MRILRAWRDTIAHLTAVAIGVTGLCAAAADAPQSIRSSTVESRIEGTTKTPPVPPSTRGLSLAAPTVGLFIGVSDYGERASVLPTQPSRMGATSSPPEKSKTQFPFTRPKRAPQELKATSFVKSSSMSQDRVTGTNGRRLTASANGSARRPW